MCCKLPIESQLNLRIHMPMTEYSRIALNAVLIFCTSAERSLLEVPFLRSRKNRSNTRCKIFINYSDSIPSAQLLARTQVSDTDIRISTAKAYSSSTYAKETTHSLKSSIFSHSIKAFYTLVETIC
jgi:hypothetical protein